MRTASWLALLLAGFATATWAQGTSGTSTSTGVSSAFNPAISLNALFLGSGFSSLAIPDSLREDLQRSGAHLQEMELQFTSTIDPYSKADAILTFEDGEQPLRRPQRCLPWSTST